MYRLVVRASPYFQRGDGEAAALSRPWVPEKSLYEYNPNKQRDDLRSAHKFLQSTFTQEGEEFIRANPPHTTVQQFLKDFMTGPLRMKHVDAASLLQVNKMFVLDSTTLLKLLRVGGQNPDTPLNRILDVGAGDGHVTETAYRSVCDELEVMEASFGCVESLKSNPNIDHVHFETGLQNICRESQDRKFDLISMLNVLDRCDKPVSMLRDAKSILAERGKLLVALTYPHRPFVVEKDVIKAKQSEAFLDLDSQATFEDFVDHCADNVFASNGYHVERFTRVPYICAGSTQSKEPYSCLSCAVFICSVVHNQN